MMRNSSFWAHHGQSTWRLRRRLDLISYGSAPIFAVFTRHRIDVGVHLYRIPIPEGLAPASAAVFDAHLTRLISMYTLTGTAVLVHCRGGVGRAGLVACCWMLKLGLCGWPALSPPGEMEALGEEHVRADTLQLVERVIGVVRRRRSLKAIETYEQVKFLVEYVEFLRKAADVSV